MRRKIALPEESPTASPERCRRRGRCRRRSRTTAGKFHSRSLCSGSRGCQRRPGARRPWQARSDWLRCRPRARRFGNPTARRVLIDAPRQLVGGRLIPTFAVVFNHQQHAQSHRRQHVRLENHAAHHRAIARNLETIKTRVLAAKSILC